MGVETLPIAEDILRKHIFILITVAGLVGLVASPTEAFNASKEALYLCLNVIVPTLFPFFVFSSLAVSFGLAEILGKVFGPIMKPLFNVNGSCSAALILGLVSGFPVGAKTTISLYQKGLCTKTEAERLLAFSNNAGPAFVLGTVGIGIWNSSKVGWMLWLTQIVSSVAVGMIFGRIWKGKQENITAEVKRDNRKTIPFLESLTESVKGSAINLIYITSFIVFFAVTVKLLSISGIIPITAKILQRVFAFVDLNLYEWESLLSGIFEFATGINSVGHSEPYSHSLTLTAAILGWAGFSVHCQVLTFVHDSGLCPLSYILGKAMQTVFSTVGVFLLSRFIVTEESLSVFAQYTDNVIHKSSIIHFTALGIIITVLFTVIALLLLTRKNSSST